MSPVMHCMAAVLGLTGVLDLSGDPAGVMNTMWQLIQQRNQDQEEKEKLHELLNSQRCKNQVRDSCTC